MSNFERSLYFVIGNALGFILFGLISCAPLESVGRAADSVAAVAAAAEPIVENIANAESPRDWFDIAWKVAAGLGIVGGGGEFIRRRRKRNV